MPKITAKPSKDPLKTVGSVPEITAKPSKDPRKKVGSIPKIAAKTSKGPSKKLGSKGPDSFNRDYGRGASHKPLRTKPGANRGR